MGVNNQKLIQIVFHGFFHKFIPKMWISGG